MSSKNRTPMIIAGVVVFVLALAGLAVLLTGGDDDGGEADGDGAPVPTYSDEAVQVRPVEVTGDPLPTLDLEASADQAVGLTAPVVEGADFDGQPISIGGPTEGPSLLVFLAHWCPHCNAEIPEILELDDAGGIPSDLTVTGISTAVEQGAPNYPPSEWVVDKGWRWPVLVDDELASAFALNGGSGFPYMLLLDADGAVVSRISGEHSADELREWLDTSLTPAA